MSKLPKIPIERQFDFSTSTFGRLQVRGMTVGQTRDLHLEIDRKPDLDSEALVRFLLQNIATREEGSKLSSADVECVTSEELETFSERFLANNEYLVRARQTKREAHQDGSTNTTSSFREFPLERTANEKWIDYLARALVANYEHWKKPRFPFPASKSFLSWAKPSALVALEKNARLSQSLADQTAALFRPSQAAKKLEFPELPPNPIHGTNQRLDALNERVGHFETLAAETVELVRTMNDAAASLLSSFVEGARTNERSLGWTLIVAIIALFVSIISSIPTLQSWMYPTDPNIEARIISRSLEVLSDRQKQAYRELGEQIRRHADTQLNEYKRHNSLLMKNHNTTVHALRKEIEILKKQIETHDSRKRLQTE